MLWKQSLISKHQIITFVLVLCADQLSKHFVMHNIDLLPYTVFSWFSIILLWNPGVLFGITLFDHPAAYVGLACMIVAFILYMFARTHCPKERWAFVFILSGALGNIIDRIRFGAVVDFIDLYAYNWHWPAFNIADAAISLSVAFLSVLFLKKPV